MIETRNGSSQVLEQYVWGTQYIDELVQIAINNSPDGPLISGLHTHGGEYTGYVSIFGERVQAKEGDVVYYDTKSSRYWVLDGVEWKREWFEDEERMKAFVKEIVESLDKYVPASADNEKQPRAR